LGSDALMQSSFCHSDLARKMTFSPDFFFGMNPPQPGWFDSETSQYIANIIEDVNDW
jgi:hypothetical protein